MGHTPWHMSIEDGPEARNIHIHQCCLQAAAAGPSQMSASLATRCLKIAYASRTHNSMVIAVRMQHVQFQDHACSCIRKCHGCSFRACAM